MNARTALILASIALAFFVGIIMILAVEPMTLKQKTAGSSRGSRSSPLRCSGSAMHGAFLLRDLRSLGRQLVRRDARGAGQHADRRKPHGDDRVRLERSQPAVALPTLVSHVEVHPGQVITVEYGW